MLDSLTQPETLRYPCGTIYHVILGHRGSFNNPACSNRYQKALSDDHAFPRSLAFTGSSTPIICSNLDELRTPLGKIWPHFSPRKVRHVTGSSVGSKYANCHTNCKKSCSVRVYIKSVALIRVILSIPAPFTQWHISPLSPAASKASKNSKKISSTYNKQTGGSTQRLFGKLVNELDAISDDSVIHDNASGPIVAVQAIMNNVYCRPTIHATDLSPAMADAGKGLAQEKGWDNVSVQVMDAKKLEFPDQTFTHPIMNLSIQNIDDPRA